MGDAAVALIGPSVFEGPAPMTLLVSRNPSRMLAEAQRWHESDIVVHALFWTRGEALAKRLGTAIETTFRNDNWHSARRYFRVEAWVAPLVVADVAAAQGIELIDPAQRSTALEREISRALGNLTSGL